MATAKQITEAEKSLNVPFDQTSDYGVEQERRPAKIVYSTRIPAEYSERIAAEAVRCGQNPSQLIATLVVEALDAREQDANTMVSLSDIQRAISAVAHRHAA